MKKTDWLLAVFFLNLDKKNIFLKTKTVDKPSANCIGPKNATLEFLVSFCFTCGSYQKNTFFKLKITYKKIYGRTF